MLKISIHHKNNITTSTFGLNSKENNENLLFGLILFSTQVYGRSQLVATRSLVLMDQHGSFGGSQTLKSHDAVIEVFKFIRYV